MLLLVGLLLVHSQSLTVYTDSLQNSFQDWSWATTKSLTATTPVHSGTYSISMVVTNWEGLYFHCATTGPCVLPSYEFVSLDLWVYGSGSSQSLVAILKDGTNQLGSSVPFSSVSNVWTKISLAASSFSIASGSTISEIVLQANSASNQGTAYFDDITLVGAIAPSPTPKPSGSSLVVDGTSSRSVNPEIFGVNFASATQMQAVRYTVNRKGGNSESRYNYLIDASNRASDWFFQDIGETSPGPGPLPSGSTADQFVLDAVANGVQPILTVPLLGYVAKSRSKLYSYSVAKYGAQQNTECTATGGATWCIADCGNGKDSAGNRISGNNPLDANTAITTQYVSDWITHLTSVLGGSPSSKGLKYWSLDNEPMLWSSTHFDVHYSDTTYDELWNKAVQYGTVVKNADSGAKLFGPVTWGFCDLFWSAAEGCGASPTEHPTHSNLDFLPWYIKSNCDYKASFGNKLLVDYVDLHWYPQSGQYSDDTSIDAVRYRSVKSLFDTSYVDESWIGTTANPKVYLIPRVKGWINQYCPEMKLAITEYNFGGINNENPISFAIVQADVLGIFAQQGVDLATRWVAPASGSMVEDAFKIYRNYDGAGSGINGGVYLASSISSMSYDQMSSHVIIDSNVIHIYIISKTSTTYSLPIQLNSVTVNTASSKTYRFSNNVHLAQVTGTNAMTWQTSSSGQIQIPGFSVTLITATVTSSSPTSANPSGVATSASPTTNGGISLGTSANPSASGNPATSANPATSNRATSANPSASGNPATSANPSSSGSPSPSSANPSASGSPATSANPSSSGPSSSSTSTSDHVDGSATLSATILLFFI